MPSETAYATVAACVVEANQVKISVGNRDVQLCVDGMKCGNELSLFMVFWLATGLGLLTRLSRARPLS